MHQSERSDLTCLEPVGQASASECHTPTTACFASRGWTALRLREIWENRELLVFLSWREVKIRYKQAVIGVAWVVLQPVLTMLLFSLVFGRVAGFVPEGNIPYPLYTLAALLPWQLFSGSLTRASVSLVGNANLLTKVYFPRLIIPLTAVGSTLIDFVCSFGVLTLLLIVFSFGKGPWHFSPSWPLLTLPLFVGLAILASLALGIWLAALNVQFRDVQYTTPFLMQVGLFLSPVAYAPEAVIHDPFWRTVYALNPMVGVIQGFRWALFNTSPPDSLLAISTCSMVILLVGGVLYFKRMERTFADIV